MVTASPLRLLLCVFSLVLSATSAKATRFDQTDASDIIEGAGRTMNPIIVPIEVKHARARYLGGQSFGNSPAAQQAAGFINNNNPNLTAQIPQIDYTTDTQKVEVPNYTQMAALSREVGGAAVASDTVGTLRQKIGVIESSDRPYSGFGLKPGALAGLTRLNQAEIAQYASEHNGQEPPSLDNDPEGQRFAAFKDAASRAASALDTKFTGYAADPPEVKEAKRKAQEQFEREEAQARQEQQNAANRAAQQAANQGRGAAPGGGNGAGSGSGDSPTTKVPAPRDIAGNFDPSKFAAPQDSLDGLKGLGPGDAFNTRATVDPINPVTMSNPGFQQSQPPSTKTMADGGFDGAKGLKLGGSKSIPQTLAFADTSPIPPPNQAGGGAGGTPPLGGGGGAGGGGATAGDPYAGVGVEKPSKPVSYNLKKDGGYGSGGGGGGEESGDKEGSVDGGGAEGMDAKTKEMVQNVLRPGQFLPPAGNADNGYPGIFAYRLYARKVCETPQGRQTLAMCRRPITYVAKAPAPSEASFIAAIQQKKAQ